MNFDLSPESMSRKALWKYLQRKGQLPPAARRKRSDEAVPPPGIELHLTEQEEEALRLAWEAIRREALLRRRRTAG